MVDTSITPPARLDPPYKEPMLDAAGLVTQLWRDWFTGISLALFGFAAGGGGGVIMQTGTSTSDPAGAIGVALPVPFNVRTLSFQVNAAPDQPDAFYVQGGDQCAAAGFHHRAAGARRLAAAPLSRWRIPTSPGSPRACDAEFPTLHAGLDVAPILAELDAAPELWDADTDRTERDGSPHADSSDIWLRWFPRLVSD